MESENITNNNNQKTKYQLRYIYSEYFVIHGRYFYKQRSYRNMPNFKCIDMHKDDTNKAFRIINHWILFITEIINKNSKNNLLIYLTNILSTFYNTKSSLKMADYLSLFFVKIVLKLGHINIIKVMNQKYDLTSEIVTNLGKILGIMM